MLNNIVLLSLLLTLMGCASTPTSQYTPNEKQSLMAQVRGEQEPQADLVILHLDQDIRAALDKRIDSDWRDKKKLRELRSYLFSDEELGVHYDATASLTATETFRHQK